MQADCPQGSRPDLDPMAHLLVPTVRHPSVAQGSPASLTRSPLLMSPPLRQAWLLPRLQGSPVCRDLSCGQHGCPLSTTLRDDGASGPALLKAGSSCSKAAFVMRRMGKYVSTLPCPPQAPFFSVCLGTRPCGGHGASSCPQPLSRK